MKLHKNALINAHFTDYSVFMHTNENAEIQQIKQFPLYNYNENEVFSNIQKLNSETRTLYSIDDTKVYFHSSKFILQPKLFLDYSFDTEIMKTISYNEKEEEFFHFDIDEDKILTCFFKKDDDNFNIKKDFNSNAKILQILIQHFGDGIYVHVHQKMLEIIVLKDKTILFYNIFTYNIANDFSYFISNVVNSICLEEENLEVKIFGRIVENSELVIQLKKFVPNIEMLSFESKNMLKAFPISQHFASIALVTQ